MLNDYAPDYMNIGKNTPKGAVVVPVNVIKKPGSKKMTLENFVPTGYETLADIPYENDTLSFLQNKHEYDHLKMLD
jgi:hypothetical protein